MQMKILVFVARQDREKRFNKAIAEKTKQKHKQKKRDEINSFSKDPSFHW